MKRRKKPWRRFKVKNNRLRRRANCCLRRVCSVILLIEAAVLWKQGQIPLISVEHQADVWVEQLDSLTAMEENVEAGAGSLVEEDGGQTVLEQIFGVRLRMEDGVIEFYRKEEKIDVTPKEK